MDEQVPGSAEDETTARPEDVAPFRGNGAVPMVALGGSAGSIQALESFFGAIPSNTGMAFVVIVHLSAEHESSLASVLQRHTRMSVVQVRGQEKVKPDTVYVIPPARSLHLDGDELLLADLQSDRGKHVAVDLFFRTLADTHGTQSSAVVLSGMDGDGASGIKRIKERGGLTIAQEPGEALHSGMPRAAIATGMVDWVLPVLEMPGRLLAYHRIASDLKLPPETEPKGRDAQGTGSEELMLRDVLALLRARTGRDFSYYKRATILRRIARRMQINGVDGMSAYLAVLRTNAGEAGALLQDLLISVTNFFRDAECFEALEAQISKLFHGRDAGDVVRVWVPACATGEEAFSIAMLLIEHARCLDNAPAIQVFATDLDDAAIQIARNGFYPATIEADVSEERLRRFFIREHSGYRIKREVRETVLFALHDLLKDSPFSRLDLVSCRNLFIYLNRDAQHRGFDIFHFALRPRGLLFLGSSESIEEGTTLFSLLDKKHRLYQHNPMPRIGLPVPNGSGTLATALSASRDTEATAAGSGAMRNMLPLPRALESADFRGMSLSEIHLKLLEHLAAPSILVSAEHEILHLSPSAGRFLQYAGGEPTKNLLRAIDPSLRLELRALLYQAQQTSLAAEVAGVSADLGGTPVSVTIRVRPVSDVAPGALLVQLEGIDPADRGVQPASPRSESDPVARHLDRELERLKAHLRATVEQYEASTEELKAGNEELQAMNEELRSATEELETSREELQSINEELTTVNQELKSKVDELGHANSDMHNLMDATAIATIFLDRELRITRYTPSAVSLFNLIPTDIGRPLADLTTPLDYDELAADATRVLARLTPVEREVGHAGGQWYLARLLPYRTIDDRIAGVVLSLVDITERRQAEEVRLWVEGVVAASTDAIVSFSLDGVILSWNGGAERIFGYSAAEAVGMSIGALIVTDDGHANRKLIAELCARNTLDSIETLGVRQDGSRLDVAITVSPIADRSKAIMAMAATIRDVTERKRHREELREREERLRIVLDNAREYAICATDLERRVVTWSTGAEQLLGYTPAEMAGQSLDVIFTDDDLADGAPQREADEAVRGGRAADERFHKRKDGSTFWGSGVLMAIRDGHGATIGFVKILRDETLEREVQQALERSEVELTRALHDNENARTALVAADTAKDRFLAVLSHELRTPLTPVLMAVKLLSLRPDLPEAARPALEMIRRNVRIEARLIDDLLDVTRIARGDLVIRRELVDLHDVVRRALETSDPDIRAKSQEIVLQLDATEPSCIGDADRLQQAIWNLLKNASKFSPRGSAVEVGTWNERARVMLRVSDQGVGIDPDAISGIFEAFAQGGEWVKREFGGMGLGLSIAKATIDAHGGSLTAHSAGREQGSSFTIELPVAR